MCILTCMLTINKRVALCLGYLFADSEMSPFSLISRAKTREPRLEKHCVVSFTLASKNPYYDDVGEWCRHSVVALRLHPRTLTSRWHTVWLVMTWLLELSLHTFTKWLAFLPRSYLCPINWQLFIKHCYCYGSL